MSLESQTDEQIYKDTQARGEFAFLRQETWVAVAAGIIYTAQNEEDLIAQIPHDTGCFFGQPNKPQEIIDVPSPLWVGK